MTPMTTLTTKNFSLRKQRLKNLRSGFCGAGSSGAKRLIRANRAGLPWSYIGPSGRRRAKTARLQDDLSFGKGLVVFLQGWSIGEHNFDFPQFPKAPINRVF